MRVSHPSHFSKAYFLSPAVSMSPVSCHLHLSPWCRARRDGHSAPPCAPRLEPSALGRVGSERPRRWGWGDEFKGACSKGSGVWWEQQDAFHLGVKWSFFSVVNENSLFPIWLLSSIRALAQPSTEALSGALLSFLKNQKLLCHTKLSSGPPQISKARCMETDLQKSSTPHVPAS